MYWCSHTHHEDRQAESHQWSFRIHTHKALPVSMNKYEFCFKSETRECIKSNKSAVGFDQGIVLMHFKILESFKGTKGDWMKSLKAFCTHFERYLLEKMEK